MCPAAQLAVIVKVLNLDCLILDEMDRVTTAIQQAQLRRLSPTLLSSSQIIALCIWIVCFVFTHKWWLICKTIRVLADWVWPAAEPALYDNPGAIAQAQAEHLPMAAVSPSQPPLLLVLALPSCRSCSQPPDLPSIFTHTLHRLFQ